MALFLQLSHLRARVQSQLSSLHDEKSSPASHAGLSTPRTDLPSAEEASLENDKPPPSSSSDDDRENEDETDPYASLAGISKTTSPDGSAVYLVDWPPSDPLAPRNWTLLRRIKATLLTDLVAFVVTAASSIDSAVVVPAAADLGVSEVAETLAGTGIYLVGFGSGALLASPLSELVGRYPVYVGTLVIFGVWIMAAGLAPNVGAQIAFRFLAGCFGSAPLTVAGGTVSDIWNARERTWGFPLFAIVAFGGPVLGPVMGAYIGYTGVLSWRWSEWIILITDGLVILILLALKEETLSPRLLIYRAHYFRKLTGDDRFKAATELSGESTFAILKRNFKRPFLLCLEPIVLFFTLYLCVIYIILFTFLDGYTFIFADVYGTNPGLTFTIFLGMFLGILSALVLVPIVYAQTKRQLALAHDDGNGTALNRESRLLFAMYGAPFISIGLFWMAWTDYPSISIWSPIVASAVIGFGIISVFLSAYMYIIDAYEVYAASALTFVALVRYLAAGGMTVVGVPMYRNLGTHWTLTVMGCISLLVLPIPYAFHRWGASVRARSNYAVSKGG